MNRFEQQISERAHARWVQNGQPGGRDVQDWLEAEAEVTLLADQARQLAGKAAPESEQLLQAILEKATVIISVKDIHGQYLLVNRRYETLFRVTLEQIAGQTDYDFFSTETADELRANDLRVLAAEAPLEFEELITHAGEARTYLTLRFPIAGPAGPPYAVCGISTDITGRKQAQRRLVAEHTVTRALAQSFTLAAAVPTILQAVCESLGWDVGLYWDVDRNADVLRCAEVWHASAAPLTAFERLSRRTTSPMGVGLPGHVWATGEPCWIANIGTSDPCARWAAALEGGMHGACGFPVRNGGELLGVMEFFSHVIRKPDQKVLDMMTSVGSQIGQFAERRQAEKGLHQREREFSLARAIQQRRIPKVAPELAGFDVAGASHPAQETGGDYLDFIPQPDGSLSIAVGDASGHGIAAALLMVETRAYLRAFAHADAGEVLAFVNRHVAQDIGEDFVTLALVRIDARTRALTYSSAGHWPAYVLDARGHVKRILRSTGQPLGLDPAGQFPRGAGLTLEPGELVLLLTDGIAEAFSPAGSRFGMERTLSSVRARVGAPSGEIVAALFAEVRAFSHDLQIDDMTAVVVQVR